MVTFNLKFEKTGFALEENDVFWAGRARIVYAESKSERFLAAERSPVAQDRGELVQFNRDRGQVVGQVVRVMSDHLGSLVVPATMILVEYGLF